MVAIIEKIEALAKELREQYGRTITKAQTEEIKTKVESFQKKKNGKDYVWCQCWGADEYAVFWDCYSGGFHHAEMLTFDVRE